MRELFFYLFLVSVLNIFFSHFFFNLGAWTSAPNGGYRDEIWHVLAPGRNSSYMVKNLFAWILWIAKYITEQTFQEDKSIKMFDDYNIK